MDVRALLREHGLHPHKGLGQNFLVDSRVRQRIVDAAEIEPQDVVLEIGAGLGTLTQALAQVARRVVAVELDEQLVNVLRTQLSDVHNVEIICGDILALDIPGLVGAEPAASTSFKVVANIPYYITSAVLRHVLEATVRPELFVVMVQREVAQRIIAQPGQMSLLAVSVQFYGNARLMFRVRARAFYPAPKVDSAVVRIASHAQLPLDRQEVGAFFRVVRAGFAQRRKQLRNALLHGLRVPAEQLSAAMACAGIDPRRRAQTLSVEEWLALHHALGSLQQAQHSDRSTPP
jgi:16S rRNA (adenine1518-N6/adenine1519-N6)-dimethyltransferase